MSSEQLAFLEKGTGTWKPYSQNDSLFRQHWGSSTQTCSLSNMAALIDFVTSLWAYCDLQTVLVVGAALLLTCWYLLPWGRGNRPPGPWAWPVVGNLLSLGKYPYETFVALSREYGDVFHIRMGSRDVVVLNSYKVIHEALVKKGEDFADRPRLYTYDKSGQDEHGLVMLPCGPFWKEQRKFTIASLRDFGVGRSSLEGKIIDEVRSLQQEVRSTKGHATNVRVVLQYAIANVIFSVVVGTRFEYDDPTFKMTVLRSIVTEASHQILSQLYNFIPAVRLIAVVQETIQKTNIPLVDYIRQQATEHRESFDPSNIRDFMDAYLLAMHKDTRFSNEFKETHVAILIGQLLGAGLVSTATTLYWALLYMILYPDIQQRVQDEIDRVVGRDQEPSLSHQNDLPYTRAVITEIMRMSPVGPMSLPRAAAKYSTISGYDIPKGTMILVNLWALMRDPTVYPEPGNFNPDRFLDQNGKFTKPETFLPFSVGRRNCLGQHLARMEIFLFFTHLMQQFAFKVPEGASEPSTKGIFGQELTPLDFELSARARE